LSDLQSGDVLWERAELSKLRAMVRAGEADVLVLNDSSRLTRNMNHRIMLREEFLHHGCRTEYVHEQPDDSREGVLLETIRGYAHEIAREKIIEGAIRGRLHRAKQLRILPGSDLPLYGYEWGDSVPKLDEHGQPLFQGGKPILDAHATYRPHPVASEIVRRIFADVQRAFPSSASPSA
jgi:DNA invertase Pin-like site-specific DNA recombinase